MHVNSGYPTTITLSTFGNQMALACKFSGGNSVDEVTSPICILGLRSFTNNTQSATKQAFIGYCLPHLSEQ